MGRWQEEYEGNGWNEYVVQVIQQTFGDTTEYNVSEEDIRQLDYVMANLDDSDKSFEYSTPSSDLSFEYHTPGPIKKKKRPSSSSKSASSFPNFNSQEFDLDSNIDKVSTNLCVRLANLSPITSQPALATRLNDSDPTKSLNFDSDDDEHTMEHDGPDEIDGTPLSHNSISMDDIRENVHSNMADNVAVDGSDHKPPEYELCVDESGKFDDGDIEPENDQDIADWTVLLDHFDVDMPQAGSQEEVIPTQRREFEPEIEFCEADSEDVEEQKPFRRLVKFPNEVPSSAQSYDWSQDYPPPSEETGADTLPQRLQKLTAPQNPGSDISSIDDLQLEELGPQTFTTVESTNALSLERINQAKRLLTLEGHQTHAVKWMQERECRDAKPFRGGILADEMGLGKTICCLALLAAKSTREEQPTTKRPTLIISPLSLIHQWEQEIKDKTTLSVGLYHGANRKRFQRSPEFYAFDIVLTTYDTLRVKVSTYSSPTEFESNTEGRWIKSKRRRDSKQLRSRLHNIYWERVILDEAHLISNSITARAQAACQLSARAKWCVTGTPIQNRLEDVHTLFQFLGITQVKNESHLHMLLQTCMLRRLKSSLAKPLPSKIEHILKISFQTNAEKKWYAAVRQSTWEQVEQHKRLGRSTRHIFELLLRLRQVCDSPRLLPPGTTSLPTVHMSTKMQVLFDHLHRAKEENAPVLVISHWTSFLDILMEELSMTNPNIRCAQIDGWQSAVNRHHVVESFQKTNDIDVLLMSLRCGALGLNLTKARYVFMMEPSWNPSLEAQAIDRTHRIGQVHSVSVYRFFMQNTIEEKIYKLQQNKRDLASNVLNRNSLKRISMNWLDFVTSID